MERQGSPADVGHTNSPSEQEWDGQVCRVNEPGKIKDVWSTTRTPRQRLHFEPPGQNPEFSLLLSTHRGEEVEGRVLTIYLIVFLCLSFFRFDSGIGAGLNTQVGFLHLAIGAGRWRHGNKTGMTGRYSSRHPTNLKIMSTLTPILGSQDTF